LTSGDAIELGWRLPGRGRFCEAGVMMLFGVQSKNLDPITSECAKPNWKSLLPSSTNQCHRRVFFVTLTQTQTKSSPFTPNTNFTLLSDYPLLLSLSITRCRTLPLPCLSPIPPPLPTLLCPVTAMTTKPYPPSLLFCVYLSFLRAQAQVHNLVIKTLGHLLRLMRP